MEETKGFSGNLQVNSKRFDLSEVLGPEDALIGVVGSIIENYHTNLVFNNRVAGDDSLQQLKNIINKCNLDLKDYSDIHRFTGEFILKSMNFGFTNLHLQTDSGNLIANGNLDFSKGSSVDLNSSIHLARLLSRLLRNLTQSVQSSLQ